MLALALRRAAPSFREGAAKGWRTRVVGRWLAVEVFGGAEVGVVAVDPVLAGWGEDIEVDGVFEGDGGVGELAGMTRTSPARTMWVSPPSLNSRAPSRMKAICSLGWEWVGDDAALLEDDAGEHALRAGDELAGEQWVELFGGDRRPSVWREGWRR